MNSLKYAVFAASFVVGGCALTHYESLDEKPQTDVVVSSNVAVELWKDGAMLQESAKEHTLKQAGLETVTLKAAGYHDAQVILYRTPAEKKNVSSHQSSVSWTSQKLGDISSDLSDLGADAATTSPTSTVMLPYNIVKFVVNLAAVPFSFTTDFNPTGYYFAYGKNQFYAEMIPLSRSAQTVRDAYKLRVKMFVMKNYPSLATGDKEYVSALAKFSGITAGEVKKVLSGAQTPAEAAEAVVKKMAVVKGE